MLWFAALFLIMFTFRFIYGYTSKDAGNVNVTFDDFFSSISDVRKNYASEKKESKGGGDVQINANYASNQKYEKTAIIKTKTSDFENDEKKIKEKTKEYDAVIQYEQNSGQKGSRQLHLLIGVNPDLFDKFYGDAQKIGRITQCEVTKVDKTNEYRQLNAKKISIEKTLQSLNELKSRNGQVADFVMLNDKILEIEEILQDLGVQLGNFDTENEFCTVKISIYEGFSQNSISLMHRLKVALEWTINYYLILVIAIFVASLAALIIILIIDKIKVMNILGNKPNTGS